MKTWRFWGGTLCSALLLARWSLPSRADEPPVATLKAEKVEAPEEEGTRVSLVLFLGPESYKMGEVNDRIDANNEAIAGSGFQAKNLSGGTGFGVGIRVAPSSRLSVQFDYDHLTAHVKANGVINATTPIEEEVEMPANGLLLTGAVHRKWRGIHFGIGAGPGYYLTHGKMVSRVGTQSSGIDVHGKGFGFHVLGMADKSLSSHLRLEFALGYRMAKTGDLKIGENPVILSDGSTLKADWSGITTRFGFSIPFDPGHYPETQNLK